MSPARRALCGVLLVLAAGVGFALAHSMLTRSPRPPSRTSAGDRAARRSQSRSAGSLAPRDGERMVADTPQGAVAAAARYLRLLDQASLSSRTTAALRALTLPPLTGQALAAEAAAAELERRLRAAGGAFIAGWRLGWRVLQFSPASARVAVWAMGMAYSSRDVLAPVYSTTVCALRFTPSAWRVWDARTEPGPTPPQDGGDPSAVRSFVRWTSAFRSFDAP